MRVWSEPEIAGRRVLGLRPEELCRPRGFVVPGKVDLYEFLSLRRRSRAQRWSPSRREQVDEHHEHQQERGDPAPRRREGIGHHAHVGGDEGHERSCGGLVSRRRISRGEQPLDASGGSHVREDSRRLPGRARSKREARPESLASLPRSPRRLNVAPARRANPRYRITFIRAGPCGCIHSKPGNRWYSTECSGVTS